VKKLLIIAFSLLTASQSHAQQMLGIATSNWSGIAGSYLNPANIGDSRTRFELDLFGVNFGVDNTLGRVNLNNAINGSASGSGIFDYANNQKFNMLFPVADVRLPGIMASFGKNTVAFSTRVRAVNQFNNFDKTFYQVVTNPPTSVTAAPLVDIQSDNFNWTMHMWSEMRLSYARVLYDKGQHFVKAGVTVSRLGGIGYLSTIGSIHAQYNPNNGTLTSTHSDIRLQTNIQDTANKLPTNFNEVMDQFLNAKGGNGWGFDIGAVYEWRTEDEVTGDQSSNQYKLRASIAINDIGGIRYNNSRGAHVTGNGTMSGGEMADQSTNYTDFTSYANSHGYYLDDTAPRTTTVKLPTNMIVGLDYHAISHLYVNGLFIMNMANRNVFGTSVYNQVTITPRWDTKWFSAALPLTYNTMSGTKVGVGMRVGGFIFGSDDMLMFFGGSHYGMNFYVGGFVPIYKKHTKVTEEHDTTPEAAPTVAPAGS
jgi:hypothetical protein